MSSLLTVGGITLEMIGIGEDIDNESWKEQL